MSRRAMIVAPAPRQPCTVCADPTGPGVVLGQWTFRGQLNIEIHWNSAYHSDTVIEQALDLVEEALESELGVGMGKAGKRMLVI